MKEPTEVKQPKELNASLHAGDVELPKPPDEIAAEVLDGEVIVIKDLFEKSKLEDIRHHLIEWAESHKPQNIQVPYAEESFHRYDRNPQATDYPRQYHLFGFNDLLVGEAPDKVHEELEPIFLALHSLHGSLVGIDDDFELTHNEPHYHPQVIHYPSGGGYFGLHRHEFAPTKIGMILALSERGETFNQGGVRFQHGNTVYETAPNHDVGDILLFKYDLPHDVYPIDPDSELDWSSEDGRWSVIMPYKTRKE